MANTTKGLSVEQRLDIIERILHSVVAKMNQSNTCTSADIEDIKLNRDDQANLIAKNEADIYFLAMEAGIDLDNE